MELESKKGLIKLNWKDVRRRVAKVEPIFAKTAQVIKSYSYL